MNRRSLITAAALAAPAAALAGPAAATPRVRRSKAITARDGAQLFHRDWGSGAPVVFVHAWALNSDSWEMQVDGLTDAGRRCITYDRRGHGRSGQPDGGYDFDTLADDLASIIDALDLTNVTLVGHSMGCADITRYLSRHGSRRIARVAFLAPAMPCLKAGPDNPYGVPAQAFEATRAQWKVDRGRWMAANADPFVRPETSRPVRDWLTAQMMATPLKVWLDCNRSLVEADFRQELARVDRPTLILHGDKDASAPLAITGERVAAHTPGAVLKVIAGAPHGLVVTDAARVNAELLAFTGG